MVEAAHSLSSPEGPQSQTLVSNDNETELNGDPLSENAKVTGDNFYLRHEKRIIDENKTENYGTQNGGVFNEGYNGNILIPCSGDKKLLEPLNREFSGKIAENGENCDDDKTLVNEMQVFDESPRFSDEKCEPYFLGRWSGKWSGNMDDNNIPFVVEDLNEKPFEKIELKKDGKGGERKNVENDLFSVGEVNVEKCEQEKDGKEGDDKNGKNELFSVGQDLNAKHVEKCVQEKDRKEGDRKNVENEIFLVGQDLNEKHVEKCEQEKEGDSKNGENALFSVSQNLNAKYIEKCELEKNGKEGDNKSGENELFSVGQDSNEKYVENFELVKDGREGKRKNVENEIFSVGDLVWGKFNSHPWWPGQIYDPSEASDLAKRCRPKGNYLLIAYFEDGSFSWRLPSQLKDFAENLDELSKQSDSIIFLTAVKSALDEISRVTELKMCCPCVSDDKKSGLFRRAIVKNAGIKEGAVGEGRNFINSNRIPFSDFEPTKLFSKIRSIAEGNSAKSLLELTWLRSCLSAFYRTKERRNLTYFHEGGEILGMEEREKYGGVGLFEDKIKGTRSRKRKSVAKLMKENAIVDSYTKKKMKNIDISPMKKISSFENGEYEGHDKAFDRNLVSVFEGENGEMPESRKRKSVAKLMKENDIVDPHTNKKMKNIDISLKKKVSSFESSGDEGHEKALDGNVVSVLDGENGNMTNSRKRKKSKFLSYPYINTNPMVEIFRSKRDVMEESKKISEIARVGKRMTIAAAKLTQTSPILKKKFRRKNKKMIEPFKIEASPEQVVSLAHSMALDPQKKLESDARDMINDFIYVYRSVAYKNDSNYKKCKSLSYKPGLGVKDQNATFDLTRTISEMKRENKRKNKKAKKTADEEKDKKGLLFIKQKLEKMTKMVENCDGDMFAEMKLSLEMEIKGLLEKIREMVNTGSS